MVVNGTDKTKKKKKFSKLRWQLGIIISLLYFFLIAAVLYSVRYSSIQTYLTAKNDMIERDMEAIERYHGNINAFDWYLDYWKEHPEATFKPMTSEELTIASDIPIYNMEEGATENDVRNMLNELSPEAKLAAAKDVYSALRFGYRNGLEQYKYDEIFLIDISEENRGYVYVDVNNGYSAELPLGGDWGYELNEHSIAQRFISGKYDSVEYEIASDDRFGRQNYYVGAVPIIVNGEVKAILGAAYNWNQFYKELMGKIGIIAISMTGILLIIYILIMFYLSHVATKPLSILQSAVSEYAQNGDSEPVVEKMRKIHSNNEVERLADAFGNMVITIDRHIDTIKQAHSENESLSNNIMLSLAQTIDAKDKYTKGHSTRVADYSVLIADKMGFSKKEKDRIYRMGLLHDIGKIGIPDEIINKPGKLNDDEYEIIKSHSMHGYEILSKMESFPELSQGARWHHERYDGTGYPDGIKGQDLPLEVRIISVADSYDAMTSNRSYRQYLPQEKVRSEIVRCSGTQFDPEVAKVMIELIDEDTEYRLHE